MKLNSEELKKIVMVSALSHVGGRYSEEDMENEIVPAFSNLKKWKRTHKSKLESENDLINFDHAGNTTFSIWDGVDISPWPHKYVVPRDAIIVKIKEAYEKMAPDKRHLLGTVNGSDVSNDELIAYAYQLGLIAYGQIHKVVDAVTELDMDRLLIESHILENMWEYQEVFNADAITRKCIVRHFENDITNDDFDAYVITNEEDTGVLAIFWHAD